ncbi:unnamed protein product [Parnassius apollo]|uniref:(apollo) hypothetical protein n=1 Tax=Parnassius apollo TaxID=110799 RepID=A0A8S3WJ43_PARAO|nr:unnamed protein product [Parnassius apollo]
MESRSTTTNLSSPPESPEFHSESTQSDNFRPATPHTGSSSHSQQPVRKPNLQDLYDMMKSSHDLRIHKHHSKQQQDNMTDETDLFFLSMSKAVKKLPKLDQTKIKLDLHTAVSQAEIRKLQTQAQILRTPINVIHPIVTRPQQPLPLQLPIQPSTSMTTFPAVPATPTLDNINSQQSASTLYNFEENNISS